MSSASLILKLTTEKRIKFYEEQRNAALVANRVNLAHFYKNKIIEVTSHLRKHPKYLSVNSPCRCKECKPIR